MRARPAVLGLVLLPAVLAAQADTSRWAVRLRTPAGVEHGDLRLWATGGRLLLESRDSAFLPLTELRRDGAALRFVVPALAARVELSGGPDGPTLRGWMTGGDGTAREWEAERIAAGIDRWPVRPRVRSRQFALGNEAAVTVIAAPWVTALATPALLATEHATLRQAAALPATPSGDPAARVRAMALGADPAVRGAVQRVMERIAASPAADSTFRRLFLWSGGLLLDLHDRAALDAVRADRAFRAEDAARALVRLGRLDRDADIESARLREAAFALWPAWAARDSLLARALAELRTTDRPAAQSLAALLQGYDAALPWWREAVRWLMERQWLESAAGRRSPAQLVATFWGRDALALPRLVVEPMGGFAATPLVDAERIAMRLLLPANAAAREWFPEGRRDALVSWRRLNWHDSLQLDGGRGERTLLGPADGVARPAIAALLADEDAIRIDPAITPLLAVATVVHEWHHLLATAARLEGRGPALRDDGRTLQLVEDDPWLAEGFAEWASEETLRPVRTSVPLLLLLDSEKRLAAPSDDPHTLGYRLVRAAAARLQAATRRATLVARLHDPVALARIAGLANGAGVPMLLRRPVTAAVVPEITFTWDAGVADHATRRLLVPPSRPER